MEAHQRHEVVVPDKELQEEAPPPLTAPPGWTKKLVPTTEKGVTLKKYDVVFIAPDGQELKSKWHLIRYLKAHPGGPSVSDFDWSSGEEIPIRRSGRVTKTETRVREKPTPKRRGKRNVSEMEGKEMTDDQTRTHPRKRTKQATESAEPADKVAAEGALAVDEVMHDVPDGSKGHGMDVMEDQVGKADDEKSVEPVESMQVPTKELVAGISEGVIAEKATDSNLPEQLKPSETGLAVNGEETDAPPKVMPEEMEHVTREAWSGDGQLTVRPESESKDDKMGGGSEEPEDNQQKTEQVFDEAHAEHKDDANEGTVETCEVEEVQVGVEKALEPSIPEEEQQKHVSSHKQDVDKPLEPSNPKEELPKSLVHEEAPMEEKTSEETNHSHLPVGAVNQ